eukprot:TRINITY_DN22781_c0_g1_i1.p1 TRINITY_DN22781_c0_g1~~TRINITY_DN22781_c0_g1_i1.p1  ORF type:complete len:541 (-),score=137.47 TRINITY_DN22781_c0_g1_i1:8-1630(-)
MSHNNLRDLYLRNKDSDKIALVSPNSNVSLSYKNLTLHTTYLSSTLVSKYEILPGDKISMVLHNSIEFVISWLAVVSIRAVACPLNPAYQLPEYTFFIKDSMPKFIIVPQHPERYNINIDALQSISQSLSIPLLQVTSNFASHVTFLSPYSPTPTPTASHIPHSDLPSIPASFIPTPDDIAMILHTSGTTGTPKGVPITQRSILTNLSNIAKSYSLTSSDVVLVVMPLFHVHGLIGCLLTTLFTSGTAVIPNKFSATDFWQNFANNNCTWYSAVPTIHQILLASADKNYKPEYSAKLKFIRSCSSSLSATTWEKIEQKFKVPVVEAYAMTEAAHQMTSNELPPGKRKAGSVGRSTGPGLKILNSIGGVIQESSAGGVGEVCVNGDTITQGYLNREQANREAFWEFNSGKWFRTGDYGKKDEDGFLSLTGRLKEMINRGGEKISPLEIDDALLAHEAVAEAVSFGVKCGKYGEAVEAAVVLKEGKAGTMSEEQLREWCKGKLADFKVPRKFYIVSQLDKTSTGKIQRGNIAKKFAPKEAKL